MSVNSSFPCQTFYVGGLTSLLYRRLNWFGDRIQNSDYAENETEFPKCRIFRLS